MTLLDLTIVVIPVLLLLATAVYIRKYVRDVVDYLVAGRVARRYVMAVGSMETALGVYTLLAMMEMKYQTGFALLFWDNVTVAVLLVMALTGYGIYRYRETRVLSFGQFLELRYNRSLRIIAGIIRTMAEMLANSIAPAVTAKFFIYFLGLPAQFMLCGISVPTFYPVVAISLLMAVIVLWFGGRIGLLVTDTLQGLLCYPIFVIIVIFIILNYSWSNEIIPVMNDRVAGESFLNPFDISKLRDFNFFTFVVIIIGLIVNRTSWLGNDTSASGLTPHEQKMSGLLSAWRGGFSTLMCVLLVIMVMTVLTHKNFADQARSIRTELSHKIVNELIADTQLRENLKYKLDTIPEQCHTIGQDAPLSRSRNLDTPYLETTSSVLGDSGEGNYIFQKFRTLYYQMMMPMTLKHILPVGIFGLVCLLMIFLMLSTDSSRIFNSSATIIQDIVMPLRKKQPSPEEHLLILKLGSTTVAFIFILCSIFFVQLDYIMMFVTIMTSIWLGGAGPIMIFGLYSRFGNTVGAFCALIFGSGFAIGCAILQRTWAQFVYPALFRWELTELLDAGLKTISSPFDPYIVWQIDPVKFPINSYEIYFLSMALGVIAYVAGSLLTYRGAFNLELLLHRGKYRIEGMEQVKEKMTLRLIIRKLVGITPEYTMGDKVIAWSVFLYTFIYCIVFCFFCVLIWNLISPWPEEYWNHYFFLTSLLISGVIGVISTVWFMIGGIIDTKKLFHDLEVRTEDPTDDGHVSRSLSVTSCPREPHKPRR